VTILTATHDPFVMEHVDVVREMSDGRLLPQGEGIVTSRIIPDKRDKSVPRQGTALRPPTVPRRAP
jgi:ABC-type lipoprotein export system ATPase subunit